MTKFINMTDNLEKEDMNERMRLLNEENSTLLTNLKELNVNDNCLLKLIAKLDQISTNSKAI